MLGNWLKTSILMAGIIALFGAIGAMIGGKSGMLMALVFGGAMNIFSYWFSDKMVLRMYNAQEVDEAQFRPTSTTWSANWPAAPAADAQVYIIHEDQPNAFATGRNPENAAVAATTGILQMLSERELRGVMAHELAHVQHRDILISPSRPRWPVPSRPGQLCGDVRRPVTRKAARPPDRRHSRWPCSPRWPPA